MAFLAQKSANSAAFQNLSFLFPSPSILDAGLRARFFYRPEIEEIVRTPEFMLADLMTRGSCEGDCDDAATLVAAFAKAAGWAVRLTAIRSHASPDFEHVFTEVRPHPSGMWHVIDLTVSAGTVHEYVERMEQYV